MGRTYVSPRAQEQYLHPLPELLATPHGLFFPNGQYCPFLQHGILVPKPRSGVYQKFPLGGRGEVCFSYVRKAHACSWDFLTSTGFIDVSLRSSSMGQFSSYKPGRNGHEYASRKGTWWYIRLVSIQPNPYHVRPGKITLTTVLAFSSFSLASPGGPFIRCFFSTACFRL